MTTHVEAPGEFKPRLNGLAPEVIIATIPAHACN
jgi:hypothetical protein